MRENEAFQNRPESTPEERGLLYIPREHELNEQIVPKTTDKDNWFDGLQAILKRRRATAPGIESAAQTQQYEPVRTVEDRPAIITTAPSIRAGITHHDAEAFFRAKVININRLREQEKLKARLAEIEACERDILEHREFAKKNRYNTAGVVDFLMGKKGRANNYYYNDHFTTRSPFSKTEVTNEALAILESRAAVQGTKIFGEPDPSLRREFCFLGDRTWFYHESDGERDVSVRYVCDDSGVVKYDNKSHARLDADEIQNFWNATKAYHKSVSVEVYRRQPADINGDGMVDNRERYGLAA
ncbi:MAG: hypothetical protein LBH36_00205 [Candidatus Nomurabacteria bacterium]|jgi:hypothetical protein|nr:hypothetical protein [Candidatus Nomurabacteria bacterium]